MHVTTPTSPIPASDDATRPFTFGATFHGPDGIVNGGYLAGTLARELGGDAEVTLRRPTPPGRVVELRRRGPDHVELRDGSSLLAEARRAAASIASPEPIPLDRAAAAGAQFLGHVAHPFPGCFVCGTTRAPGAGLRVFTGPVSPGLVAAAWVPTGAPDGELPIEHVAAALDCPGGWAVAASGPQYHAPMLLGRIVLTFERPVLAGRPHLVLGRHDRADGRKHAVTTAIHDADGRRCAAAHATWIQVS